MAVIVNYRGAGPALADADVSLGDRDVLPADLSAATNRMDHIDIADPLSFPFENLSADGWTTPMTVHLPDLSFEELTLLLDESPLSKLTVVDSVSAADETWDRLHPYYGWPRSMRVDAVGVDLRRCVDLIATTADLLDTNHGESTAGFALRSRSSKRWMMAVGEVIADCIEQAGQALSRDRAVHLHGWGCQPYLPYAWDGLSVVVERRPAAAVRLRQQYRRPRFQLSDHADPGMSEVADVVVGVDLGEAEGDLTMAYERLFHSARVGGTIVVAERFHEGLRPNDLIERLLDASGHDVVLDRVEPIRLDEQEPLAYSVLAMTKLGMVSRL